MVSMVENEGEQSKGGIWIPAAAQERPTIGIVRAVGPGRIRPDGTTMPNDVHVGDMVLLGKYSGMGVSIDGTNYMILDASEVLGILHKEVAPIIARNPNGELAYQHGEER
jgi:chaperonin GroES